MKRNRKIIAFFLTALIVLAAMAPNVTTSSAASASITGVRWDNATNRVYFTLTFSGMGSGAWVAVVPSGTAKDENSANSAYKSFKYLKNMTSGKEDNLSVSLELDKIYSLYVFSDWPGGTFVCSKDFVTDSGSASLSGIKWDAANNKVYFTLAFSNVPYDAWIGVVPAGTKKDEIEADKVDVSYKYLRTMTSGKQDSLDVPGLKDGKKFELHVYATNNGGKYLCGSDNVSSSTVNEPTASISGVKWDKSKETVYFTLTFKNVSKGAWIGIVPAGTKKDEKEADKVDVCFKYLKNMTSGKQDSLTKTGLKDGNYELHVYEDTPGGKYLCSASFTVGKKDGKIAEITILMNKGETVRLGAIVDPSDADITWSTSNKKVATVSANGKVAAKKKGTAVITAQSGSSSKTIKIVVEK